MSQSARNIGIAAVVLVALLAGVWWSQASKAAPSGRLVLAGDVRPEVRSVSAPAISYPTPDYTVGIPGTSTAGGSSKRASAKPTQSGQPVVAGMLERVWVREGDHVTAGQVLATFDTTMLDLGVAQAQDAATQAHKQVKILGNDITKLNTASGKIVTARGKLATAKKTLTKAKAALLKAGRQLVIQRRKLLQLKAQRPQLKAALAGLKAALQHTPPGPKRAAIQKQIAQISGALAAIDPGLNAIAAGIQKLAAGFAKIKAGAAALPKAAAQLNTASAQLSNAKTQLHTAKDVLSIVARGQKTAIQLAEAKRVFAVVRSPVDGVVTFARRSRTVAMVGAPLVRIHTDGPQRIDTYLTADQVARIHVGSPADITYDSAPKGTVLHGAISEIGSAYVFPPTSFPTQIVHMTRALKVTIKLDEGSTAPPGTPVDVTIRTDTSQ
jgi:multidrug resistance efflux pump